MLQGTVTQPRSKIRRLNYASRLNSLVKAREQSVAQAWQICSMMDMLVPLAIDRDRDPTLLSPRSFRSTHIPLSISHR